MWTCRKCRASSATDSLDCEQCGAPKPRRGQRRPSYLQPIATTPRPSEPVDPEDQKFADDVLACVDDLNAVLPRLALKYDDLVIVAALAEHVGGALRIFSQAGIASPAQVERVLMHIGTTARGAS